MGWAPRGWPPARCVLLYNRRHVGDLASSISSPHPRATHVARLPQRRQQFATQGAAGQQIQAHLAKRCFCMSSGYLRWRGPTICSEEQASARCVRTYATARGRRVYAVAVADRLWRPLGSAPYRPDREAPHNVAGYHAAHGAGGLASTLAPSSVTTGPEKGPAHILTVFSTHVRVALFLA